MEIHTSEFMRLSVNEVSDLLLSEITDDKKYAGALVQGVDQGGRKYKLKICLELDQDD
jgi:hypothetical protein